MTRSWSRTKATTGAVTSRLIRFLRAPYSVEKAGWCSRFTSASAINADHPCFRRSSRIFQGSTERCRWTSSCTTDNSMSAGILSLGSSLVRWVQNFDGGVSLWGRTNRYDPGACSRSQIRTTFTSIFQSSRRRRFCQSFSQSCTCSSVTTGVIDVTQIRGKPARRFQAGE